MSQAERSRPPESPVAFAGPPGVNVADTGDRDSVQIRAFKVHGATVREPGTLAPALIGTRN